MAQFLFYPLFLRLFLVSLSLSRLSWSKKPPAPFVFFFDFFPSFGRDHGSVKRQSSPKATGSKKKKSRRQLFRPRFQSAFLCHHQQILSFSDCARKSSIATKKTTYSHTRYNSKKNVFRSFLLCWHQSRRQDERPRLFLLEKSLLGASLRGKKIMVGSRCFFLIRKSQAQARERAF